ncbi:MAG: hypothetical protein ED554_06490 [Synechococcus sp. YX04-3]|nr:MAG: hypothetical protein ED554_06490 [Synechococcus sp. YX04-3]
MTRHQTVEVRGSWHIAISITETMKRKAEIRFTATFVVTADLTDARWKKLVGDYFEPGECSWKEDHPTCIQTWAEEQVTDALRVEIDNLMPASIQLNHVAENSDGKDKFQVEEVDLDYDGIELTVSL